MSFIQFPTPTPVFPVLPPLAWSVHKKPIMASRAITATTGRETQLACCVYPRWHFTLTYGGESWLRDQTQNSVPDPALPGLTELEQLSGLFLQCRGSYGEFYYSDPDDYSRSAQAVGIGDGTTTTFPLTYSWGTGPFSPAMTVPVGGIERITAVYFNGSAPGAVSSPPAPTPPPTTYYSWSMDATNTQLVFNYPPPAGAVITADFTFYFRCRFMDDTQEYSQWAQNLWEVQQVQFESVKP